MRTKPARLFDHGNPGPGFDPGGVRSGFDPILSGGNHVPPVEDVPAAFSTTMSAGVCVPLAVERPRRVKATWGLPS